MCDHSVLLKEDATADDIHRRPQAQFTDDIYSIRGVRRWRRFGKQDPEDLYDDPRSDRPPIDFIETKILSALERTISFCTFTR
jgi:hypothetical protein